MTSWVLGGQGTEGSCVEASGGRDAGGPRRAVLRGGLVRPGYRKGGRVRAEEGLSCLHHH